MRRLSRTLRTGLALSVALAALAAGGAAHATPSTALGNVQTVSIGGDLWWNYDFVSKSDTTNVDWPVDLVFYGQASVSKVQSRLGWLWPSSNAYQYVNDGTGWSWAASPGRKTGLCGGTQTHVRLYADSDGALWNPILGYYVIATAHLDVNECGSRPTYGSNETAEANVAARWSQRWPSDLVTRNAQFLPGSTTPLALLNAVTATYDGGVHSYLNDGFPTLIRVP